MGEKATYRYYDLQANTWREDRENYADNKQQLSDSELWASFQSGSEAAFATMYQDHVQRLYAYGLQIVRDEELVKDTIQTLFVELWDARSRLGKVDSIKAYLIISLRRKLIGQAAKRRKWFDAKEDAHLTTASTPSAERKLIEKDQFDEKLGQLERALDKLSPKQREIIHLKFYAQLGYKEITQVMGLPKKGAYNLMARTIAILKNHLQDFFMICLLVMS
ncbi:MAG: sigma-70 family RNA polymerase sigma factor [Bacteroidota bacterium]